MENRNTKDLILKQALDEFCQYGFNNTFIKKFASKAEISCGFLYNDCLNKED